MHSVLFSFVNTSSTPYVNSYMQSSLCNERDQTTTTVLRCPSTIDLANEWQTWFEALDD